MKKLVGIILVLALLGGGAWLIFGKNSETLRSVNPQKGPVVQAVYATGTVEPTIMVPISPRSSARLLSLNTDEGETVAKDQVMAQLEDTDLQGRLSEAQAQADLAKKDYDRKAPLAKKGFVSKQDFDQAQAAFRAAAATVEQIRAEMGYLKLLAPEAGTVIRRDGEVGEMAGAGKPVFWISCCAPMRISAEIDEEDVSLVKPGQSVLIGADAFPGEVFHGTVQSITPKGDDVARSYRVRISLNEDAQKLMIGMTAETNIVIAEKKDALLLPVTAVKNSTAWVVNKGRLEKRTVTTGARTPKAVEILKGINEGETVIADAPADLEEGARPSTKPQAWDMK
ncbi:MAG: efflux RND transporter periplasmic adaptor subunit [Alphaproteobacteria bacterium]